jgi:hypothetical protein
MSEKSETTFPIDKKKFCGCNLMWWWENKEWECILEPSEAGPKWRGHGKTAEDAYKSALTGKDKFR